jgi:signal transduction histidine kinase
MEALGDGMLAYARATKKTSPEDVDVGRLVREVVELLDPPARITIHVQPNLPTVNSERVPFQQVVMNLLSNAIKHGRADSPQIDVACADEVDDYDFQIADNGPGIPPEAQSRIWEIFQTLESRDKVEGSGIGLAVVKRIIETHGGRAWVESVPGSGATFHFTWPKAAPQSAEARA